MCKKLIIIISVILAVAVILDFIPVKYAVSTEMVDKTQIEDNSYSYDAKSPISNSLFCWNTTLMKREGVYAIITKIIGENPYDVLSASEFDLFEIYQSGGMGFKFYGDFKMLDREESEGYDLEIHSEKWDVIKPINRTSFRRHYVSKDYLTIYDFDWIKVIKGLFK